MNKPTDRAEALKNEEWFKHFKKGVSKAVHCGDDDCPIWLAGFYNVLLAGQTSHRDDNLYDPDQETLRHRAYKAGAKAAESLLAHRTP